MQEVSECNDSHYHCSSHHRRCLEGASKTTSYSHIPLPLHNFYPKPFIIFLSIHQCITIISNQYPLLKLHLSKASYACLSCSMVDIFIPTFTAQYDCASLKPPCYISHFYFQFKPDTVQSLPLLIEHCIVPEHFAQIQHNIFLKLLCRRQTTWFSVAFQRLLQPSAFHTTDVQLGSFYHFLTTFRIRIDIF